MDRGSRWMYINMLQIYYALPFFKKSSKLNVYLFYDCKSISNLKDDGFGF